ncbi:MAG: NAD(P)H-hydrate dehydratase [Akkermansiaceae bacterium]|nr:NAD(P)H-hydrate dehydratase [Akkermansiaceae bacterium]
MGSITCAEMRRLEEDAFKQGSTPEGLMEKAGCGIAAAILRRYHVPGTAVACIGSGNNGGDALVALRYLAEAGWKIGIRCLHAPTELGVLPRKKWRQLPDCPVNSLLPDTGTGGALVLLDGLLGIGAKGPLRPPLAELAAWMNRTRESHHAQTIAMDIPSGLNGDTGEVTDGAVIADLTLTIGVPKAGLFFTPAVNHTGSIETVPIAELPIPDDQSPTLNDVHSLQGVLPRRPHGFHKGDAGRVGIVAGAKGMLGAAVLCATGALRGGAGLVTLFTDPSLYPVMAPMLPPEVMLTPIDSLNAMDPSRFDALAVGPGLGAAADAGDGELLSLLQRTAIPLVIDADGLNRIAHAGAGPYIKANTILTPHPGEWARLFPGWAMMDRLDACEKFTNTYEGSVLLLKGARSLIARSGKAIYLNGTGNSGMASGGQGDVLTGVIAALLAQGLDSVDAARMGAWLCGRAAELAISHGNASAQSLTAGDVSDWLGRAFRDLSCWTM